MKKHLITLILFTTINAGFAQTVSYGLKAGVNFAKQSLSNVATPVHSNLLTGANVGGIVDFAYTNFSIQPGLFFTTKGERFVQDLVKGDEIFVGGSTTKYILNYIEVPVNFLYKTPLVNGAGLRLGGGPYFAYGLSAKLSRDGTDYHGSFGNNPTDAAYYKNPDYGLNFIAGATIDRYIFDLQYDLGLANLAYSSATLQNRVISFSVGYLFK
ncbi:MAG: porin family protein [Bacteroidota bacterium]